MKKLPKQNILLLFLLIVITGGIYIPIYFIKLRKSIDILKPKDNVSPSLLTIFLVTSILEIVFMFPGVYISFFDSLSGLLFYLDGVLTIVIAFQFKNILAEKFKDVKFSGAGTFFFTLLYLQYKINNLLEK